MKQVNFIGMSSAKKTLILILSLSLGFTSCRHNKDLAKHSGKEDLKHSESNPLKEKLGLTNKEIRESKLYRFVNDWYGVPYKYGGCQKSGVDCSCFTDILYETVYGTKTGRTAGEIYKECDKVHSDKMRQGDLVFFKINSSSISHVGVYLKDNKFVHASTSKGVIISDLNETYYKKYFYAAGRLKHAS
jgi:lipoprotein Spr